MEVVDNRPVFVLATAKNCPHCHTFRNNIWGGLKPQIENSGKVRLVEIDLPSTGSQPDDNIYPVDVRRYIRWFPTMFVIEGQSWNKGLKDKRNRNLKLNGSVLGGQFKGDVVEYASPPDMSERGILGWLDGELKKPLFIAGSSQGSPVMVEEKPTYVLTSSGRPVENAVVADRPDSVKVVPTYGSICSRQKYRSRNS